MEILSQAIATSSFSWIPSHLTNTMPERNNLTGTIPEEVCYLTNLTSINVGHNALRGTIPTLIDKLVNLAYISFGQNQLSGAIP